MQQAGGGSRVIRFGVYEVDLQTSELRKSGLKIKLHGQPFEILAMLLEHPDEVVTREALRQKLWPADTFVDFEHGLNKAVNKLREALDDSADTPRFIETLPRLGYRFIYPVQSEQEAIAEPRSWWHRRWVAALALAAVPGLLVGLLAVNVAGLRDRLLGRPVAGEIASIAVLPLKNLSGDPEQDYFAEGFTEALITELGKISALRVISRTSVMQYKDTRKPLPQIAQELSVDALVEGAVLREGGRVRVTAQLVQMRPERHLWAERYERDLTSILLLQSEVAQAIAGEVRAKLTPQEQALLAIAHPVNPEAYEAYLKGLFFIEKLTEEEITKAIAYFRQAIDIDPTYAPAYAGLADGYNRAAIHGYQPAKETYPMAKAAVSRALELDDTLAEAHVLAGVIKFRFDWDWAGAERDLKQALQLNPNSSRAHLGYSTYLLAMGRIDDAVRVAQRNVELDPLTVQRNLSLELKLSYAGRYDDAITRLGKALELAPDSALAYGRLATNYAAKSMYAEAIAMCEKALDLASDSEVLRYCGHVYELAGRRRQAHELLKRMLAQSHVSPYQVALLHDALGDRNEALQWLVQAYEARAPEMCRLKIDTFSAQLRSDPRFQDLLRRMNFPE